MISCVSNYYLSDLQKNFSLDTPIIRCIPSSPISLRQGTIGIFKNEHVSSDFIRLFYSICSGPLIHNVEDEKTLDILSILCGSTPQFLSHLTDQFVAFGLKNGLSYIESKNLFIWTCMGTLSQLRRNDRGIHKINNCSESIVEIFKDLDLNDIFSIVLNKSLVTVRNNVRNTVRDNVRNNTARNNVRKNKD